MTIGQKIPDKPTVYTEEELAIQKEMKRFSGSYIFVNTNFKRTSEPIFALAFCEHFRNLSVNKNDMMFKSTDEILDIVSDTIKKHYIENNGSVNFWGKIVNYAFHLGEDVYVFDTNGNILNDIEVAESRASMRLK